MHEFDVDIATKAGVVDSFVCHPEEGGPHPAVIFYMDAPAIREELRDMARRLATVGYYVVLPNMYYRTARPANYGFDYRLIRTDDAERAKMSALMNSLTNAMVVDDTAGLLAFIRKDANAAKGPIGCVGYCMSGRYVMSVGAAYPDDFAAIASYYGVGILTDKPDSPHLQVAKIKAEVYLAFAAKDSHVPQSEVDALGPILEKAGTNARIELYPGTEHGFAFPERAVYVKAAGERHWERMLALFDRQLLSHSNA